MSRSVVIHVGHGKTGTSYIQSALALNRDQLDNLGISYPYDESIDLAVKGDTTSGNGGLFQSNYVPTPEENDQILFSSEILFHSLIDDGGLSLNNYLSNKYQRVKIILYTRDVLDMLVSTWGQLVKKMGATIGLNDYIQSRKDRHHEKVISWIKLSEKRGFELELRNYSKCRDYLLKSFYSCLNLNDLQTKNFLLPQHQIINRSLSNVELECLRVINKAMPNVGHHISDKLITECRDCNGNNPRITKESLDVVKSHYEHIIDQINEFLPSAAMLSIGNTDKYVENDNNLFALNGTQVNVFASEIVKSLSNNNNVELTSKFKEQQKENSDLSNALSSISKIFTCDKNNIGADSLIKLKHPTAMEQTQIVNSIRNIAYRIEGSNILDFSDIELLESITIKLSPPQLISDLGLGSKLDALKAKIADVAEKAKSGKSLDISDALTLMKVALALRPNGPILKQKVDEYEQLLKI